MSSVIEKTASISRPQGADAPAPPRREFLYVFTPVGAIRCDTHMLLDVKAPHEVGICLTACRKPFMARVGNTQQTLNAMLASPAPRRLIDARGVTIVSFRIAPMHPLFRQLCVPDLMPLDRNMFTDLDATLVEACEGGLHQGAANALFEEVIERTAALLPKAPPRDERVTHAIELIRAAGPELSQERIAEKLGLSPSRLSHLFTQHMGMSLRSFQTWRRTARAWGLLLGSQLTMTQIAQQLGFSDAPHFARTFQQYTGQSPSQVRDRRSVMSLSPEV